MSKFARKITNKDKVVLVLTVQADERNPMALEEFHLSQQGWKIDSVEDGVIMGSDGHGGFIESTMYDGGAI